MVFNASFNVKKSILQKDETKVNQTHYQKYENNI
jgi:hypothetical protein